MANAEEKPPFITTRWNYAELSHYYWRKARLEADPAKKDEYQKLSDEYLAKCKDVVPMSLKAFKINKAEQFRQLAEMDYLGFRQLCRLEQPSMSLLLFSGQQSIEKYIKATLLLHGRSIDKFGHNLGKGLWIDYLGLITDKNEKAEAEKYFDIIKDFNHSEFARYAAYDVKVDYTLHHRLDKLIYKLLRPKYNESIKSLFPDSSPATDLLQQAIDNKDGLINSYHALTEDNHALGFAGNKGLSVLRPINYRVPTTIIIMNENHESKDELEKFLGVKLSKFEYERTFTITLEELSNIANRKIKPHDYVKQRREAANKKNKPTQ
jgi:hypothetical protein